MKYILSLIAICSLTFLQGQNSIQTILSNARNFDQTVEIAESYFQEKHPGLTSKQLCEGTYRDGDFVKFMRWKAYWAEHLNPDGTLGDITAVHRESSRSQVLGDYDDIEWSNLSYENYMDVQIGMGRTTSLAFHPIDPNIFYVGAAIGGIWKTTDAGQTYIPLGDDLPFLAVSSIIVDQEDPNTIYIALSDHVWYGPPSIGVYKSSDGGETWGPTALSFDFSENIRIYWMAADPSDPDHILVATAAGLYSTNDGFNTYTQLNGFNSSDVRFHPTNPAIAYLGATNGNFYRSSDGGNSFSFVEDMGSGACSIVFSSADPEKVFVRSGVGLKKSFDAGLSFDAAIEMPENNCMVLLSPANDEVIIAGNFEIHKSVNGGADFQVLTHWYGLGGLPTIHVDHRNAFVNPLRDDIVYFCNDGGVNTMDVNSNVFSDLSDGLLITQFYDIAVSQSDENVIGGGSQDNGNVFRDADQNWDFYAGTGDGMNHDIDPDDEDRRYWSYQLGGLQRYFGGNSSGMAPPGEDGNGAWETPYKIDPNESSVLVCGYNEVYRSSNYGVSWTSISPVLSSNDLQQLAIAPSNSERIYVTQGNKIWVKDTSSDDWTQNNLPSSNISDLEVDPIDSEKIYVTVTGYSAGLKVYRSLDAGDSWENISGDLPNTSTGAIETYTVHPGGVFVGTDAGVYYRDDIVTDWQLYGTMPNTRVEDIEIQYASQLVRIGTHGRGVLEAAIVIGICLDGIDDEDLDGVCDTYDVCMDFDDTQLGTTCDDGDENTIDDVYVDCDECAGTSPIGLSDLRVNLFVISPNPSQGLLELSLKTAITGRVGVYAISGELVFSQEIEKRSTVLDLFELAPSLYILRLESQDGEVLSWEKLVIE